MWHTARPTHKEKPLKRFGSFSRVCQSGNLAVKVSPLKDPTLIYLRWCQAIQRGELDIHYEHGPEIYAIVPKGKYYTCVMKRYKYHAGHKVLPVKELYRALQPFTKWLEQQGYVMGGRIWDRTWQRALVDHKGAPYGERESTFRTDLHNGNYLWDNDSAESRNDWNLIIIDPLAGKPKFKELELFKEQHDGERK